MTVSLSSASLVRRNFEMYVCACARAGACVGVQLNPDATPFQRKYVSEVRRCDEMERKLRMCTVHAHAHTL